MKPISQTQERLEQAMMEIVVSIKNNVAICDDTTNYQLVEKSPRTTVDFNVYGHLSPSTVLAGIFFKDPVFEDESGFYL
jgi:hypothetical protein